MYIKDMISATALEKDQFDNVVESLMKDGDLRMACLCLLAGRAMRVGDLISLNIEHCFDMYGQVRQSISIVEQKTAKWKKTARIVPIWNDDLPDTQLKQVLAEYHQKSLRNLSGKAPLFTNLKRGTRITRQGVNHVLQQFKFADGIEQISAHSLRKMPGRYLHRVKKMDVETISKIYGHESPETTMAYLGITSREVQNAWNMVMV